MEPKRRLQKFAQSTRELWTRHGARQAVRDNLDKLTKCRTLALGAEIYASDSERKTIAIRANRDSAPAVGIERRLHGSASNGVHSRLQVFRDMLHDA